MQLQETSKIAIAFKKVTTPHWNLYLHLCTPTYSQTSLILFSSFDLEVPRDLKFVRDMFHPLQCRIGLTSQLSLGGHRCLRTTIIQIVGKKVGI